MAKAQYMHKKNKGGRGKLFCLPLPLCIELLVDLYCFIFIYIIS